MPSSILVSRSLVQQDKSNVRPTTARFLFPRPKKTVKNKVSHGGAIITPSATPGTALADGARERGYDEPNALLSAQWEILATTYERLADQSKKNNDTDTFYDPIPWDRT